MGNASGPFGWEVHPGHETVRVALRGELDMATTPQVTGVLMELSEAGHREVVVDLRALLFLDSTGLRCFLDLQRSAREHGSAVTFIPGPSAIQRVFELAGVTHAMTFRAVDA